MIEVAKGFHELHNSLAETTHCFIMFATIYLVVSLCKPRTSYSVTALHTCMCMLGFSLGPIIHRKFQITAIYVACLCSKSYCLTVASAWKTQGVKITQIKACSSLQCLCPPYIYHLHRIHLAEKVWEVGIHNEVLAVESFSLPFASNVTWSYGMALLRYRGGVPHWMNAVHCISHMHSSSWSKASKFFFESLPTPPFCITLRS